MKRYSRQLHNKAMVVWLACMSVMALFAGPAPAADKHFIGPSGLWNTPAVWSPAGIPATNDNVYLDINSAANDYVSYNVNITLNNLNIYNQGAGSMTLHQGNLGVTYNLTTVNEIIGANGIGSHYQYRGTNTVTNLHVGGGAKAGTYYLKGGAVNAATLIINSNGKFDLSSGTLTAGTLNLNPGGTFNQTGGTMDATFNHNGGTVLGTLVNKKTYSYTSGDFAGRLVNDGSVQFNADFTATNGMENRKAISLGSRNFQFNGLGLTNNSSINLNETHFKGSGPILNNNKFTGSVFFEGTGVFTNNGAFTGSAEINNNTINYNYGTWRNSNYMGNSGDLVIQSGSTLHNFGSLMASSEYYESPSTFYGGGKLINQASGVISTPKLINLTSFENKGLVHVSDDCSITNSFPNSGILYVEEGNLHGGTITNATNGAITGSKGFVGNNITNNGTIEAKGGPLLLGGAVTNTATGKMIVTGPESQLKVLLGLANNQGKITLTGGEFDNSSQPWQNTGQISGYGSVRGGTLTNKGTMTFTGGNTTVVGAVVNDTTGKIALYHTTLFTDLVTNNGTIKTYGVAGGASNPLVFAGGYAGGGAFSSDPATNIFSDASLDPTGHFIAGPIINGEWDRFIFQNDFINQSKENLKWKTLAAELKFINGDDNLHLMYLPGSDQGASRAGFQNNFAWGILDLSGQTLNLLDGNTTSGGAFYVSEILGAELTGQNIANIFGHGLNIYYDPLLAGNAYLHGRSYVLQDGGLLAPISATPVPGSLWLALSGLAGLIVIGRRGFPDRKS